MKKSLLLLSSALLLGVGANAQLIEDFSNVTAPNLPTGWVSLPTVTPSAWRTGNKAQLSSQYFSIPGTASNKLVAINDDGDNIDYSNAILTTSSFSTVGVTNPFFNYKAFFLKAQVTQAGAYESLNIKISTDGGTTWTQLFTDPGNTINALEDRFINLSSYTNQSNIKLQFIFNDGGGWAYGAAIDDLQLLSVVDKDIQLVTGAPLAGSGLSYATVGSNVQISGTVKNMGAQAITSYVVKYRQGATGAVQSHTVTGANIQPFSSAAFTHATPFTVAGQQAYPIDMWVELAGDNNQANDSLNGTVVITGVASKPAKKVLFEEGTGTWCGWCPRGMVYLDSFANSQYGPNASLVAVHNQDPMAITAYDNAMGPYRSGFPNLVSDRAGAQSDPSQIFTVYNQLKDNFGFATITATPTVNGTNATISAKFTPGVNINAQKKVALIITEDGVKGTGSSWNQANYYAGGNSGAMGGWESKGSSVSGVVYDHVARYISSPTGDATSLPATMTAGQDYTVDFNATLNATWTGDLHYIVVLFNENGSIDNTTHGLLRGGTSVKNIASDVNKLAVYPNPITNGNAVLAVELKNAQSATIKITDVMGREVSSQVADLKAGENQVKLNTENLTSGNYFINFISEQGNTVTKFTVAK